MLNLESTSSRMSHLARQEIYRDRTDTLDEMLAAIERVTADDVHRLSEQFFAKGDSGGDGPRQRERPRSDARAAGRLIGIEGVERQVR